MIVHIRDGLVEFQRLTPPDEQWFFGYYDNPAFSMDDRHHLAHRVASRERLPTAADRAELAEVDIADGRVNVFAETRAWNFQQGSMLQWVGERSRTVFYNAAHEDGTYAGVLHDLDSGVRREMPLPLANLSRDGRLGLSVNFDRIFDFRPGYGYCARRDPWFEASHPVEDGVWVVDVASASARQVLSLAAVWEAMRPAFGDGDAKICVNHITFNPRADRFVLLARQFPTADNPHVWGTTVLVSDLKGRMTLPPLVSNGYASHYWWSDNDTLLFHAEGPDGKQLYWIDVVTGARRVVDPDFFRGDGHCSLSPDGQWILYDSYPKDGHRALMLYGLERRRGECLGWLRDVTGESWDVRCDLHPRWNRVGDAISLDATFEGFRGVYRVDLRGVMGNGKKQESTR